MKILTKYILKEHFWPLLFALSALTSLLLLNYIAKRFGDLVGKGLPWNVIAEFLLLSVPFTVAMTLPMAVLVSTLHAFSRMASENEITAFKASGIALQKLMVPVILAAGVLTVTMVWFNDQVLPAANHRLTTLTNDIARKKPTFALKEVVINEVSPGRLFLSTSKLSDGDKMKDVTIFDLSDPLNHRTIRADNGRLALSADRRDLLLTLYHGSLTELQTEEPGRLRRVFFDTDFVKVRNIGNSLERDSIGGQKSDREMTVCELQQVVTRLTHNRDSVYHMIQSLDPNLAKTIHTRPISGGLGSLYCKGFKTPKLINSAVAAELPPRGQNPQSGTIPPDRPPQGKELPSPSEFPSQGQRQVQAAQLALQYGLEQGAIDGNQVEIEKKFAIAAACTIFVLLGAPIALRFPRGGVGLTIGVSFGVFALYYVGLVAGEALARANFVSPFLAMWSTNILLLAVGGSLTARLGREGTTSRGSETSEFIVRLRERFAAWRGAKA